MDKITLSSLFEQRKGEFIEQLNDIYLPRDAAKFEKIETDFLKSLLEKDGAYRQSLSEDENAMLESTLQLMQSQQHIAAGIAASLRGFNLRLQEEKSILPVPEKLLYYYPVLGAALGSAIGSFWNTWTTIAGAVVLTAISIFIVTVIIKISTKKIDQAVIEDSEINPEVFAEVVGNICDKIDDVIETYRTQVRKMEV